MQINSLKADRNRWRRFLEHAQLHREADLAHGFLAVLERQAGGQPANVEGRSLEEWIGWARSWIEAHDAAAQGAEAVFIDVATVTSWTYRDD